MRVLYRDIEGERVFARVTEALVGHLQPDEYNEIIRAVEVVRQRSLISCDVLTQQN